MTALASCANERTLVAVDPAIGIRNQRPQRNRCRNVWKGLRPPEVIVIPDRFTQFRRQVPNIRENVADLRMRHAKQRIFLRNDLPLRPILIDRHIAVRRNLREHKPAQIVKKPRRRAGSRLGRGYACSQ